MKRSLLTAISVAVLLAGCGSAGSKTTSSGTKSATHPLSVSAAMAPWHLPAAVSRAVAVANGNHILVLGGLIKGDVSTDAVTDIDPASGQTKSAGHIAQRLHDAGGTATNGEAFIFGGGEASTKSVVQQWTTVMGGSVVGQLPTPRSDLSAVLVGGRSIILGGFNGTTLSASVLATTDGTRFTTIGQLAQPVRYAAVAVSGSKIWIFGGETQSSEGASAQRTDIVQTFDTTNGTSAIVGHLPSLISHASAFNLDGTLFVAGGRTSTGASSAILQVNTANGSAAAAGSLPQAQSDAATASIGNNVWLVGGEITGATDPIDTAIEITAK